MNETFSKCKRANCIQYINIDKNRATINRRKKSFTYLDNKFGFGGNSHFGTCIFCVLTNKPDCCVGDTLLYHCKDRKTAKLVKQDTTIEYQHNMYVIFLYFHRK